MAVDPSARDVPLCPLKAITGIYCPFCGSLRAVHALAHLDLATALDHNVLFTLSVPFLVVGWVVWLGVSRGWTRPSWWRADPPVPLVLGLVLFAFAGGAQRPGPGLARQRRLTTAAVRTGPPGRGPFAVRFVRPTIWAERTRTHGDTRRTTRISGPMGYNMWH